MIKGGDNMKNVNYEIKYNFFKPSKEYKDVGFGIGDVLGVLNDNRLDFEVLEIVEFSIENNKRSLGHGSKILKSFCDSYSDKLIYVKAGALESEYEEEPTEDEFLLILKRLDNFYRKLGFIDVNNRIGCYQYSNAYVYGNAIGQTFIQALNLK